MPNYDYRCPDCDTVAAREVPVDARDEPFECPSCATLMRRLFSAPSLQRMVGIGKRRR